MTERNLINRLRIAVDNAAENPATARDHLMYMHGLLVAHFLEEELQKAKQDSHDNT